MRKADLLSITGMDSLQARVQWICLVYLIVNITVCTTIILVDLTLPPFIEQFFYAATPLIYEGVDQLNGLGEHDRANWLRTAFSFNLITFVIALITQVALLLFYCNQIIELNRDRSFSVSTSISDLVWRIAAGAALTVFAWHYGIWNGPYAQDPSHAHVFTIALHRRLIDIYRPTIGIFFVLFMIHMLATFSVAIYLFNRRN